MLVRFYYHWRTRILIFTCKASTAEATLFLFCLAKPQLALPNHAMRSEKARCTWTTPRLAYLAFSQIGSPQRHKATSDLIQMCPTEGTFLEKELAAQANRSGLFEVSC